MYVSIATARAGEWKSCREGRLPGYGRFLQADPIGYQDSPNLYAYVGNDPINYIDPLGLDKKKNQPCPSGDVCVDGNRIPKTGQIPHAGTAPRAPGPSGSKKSTPKSITITKSCQNVPALQDPRVQAAALNALKLSVAGNASGTAEWGFFVSQAIFGSNWIGKPFSGGFRSQIPGEVISRQQPSAIGSVLTGYWPSPVFIHTHPNNVPPSPVSPDDGVLAESLGGTVVAIDKAGNVTCTTGK
jgi:hypothetical protein